LQQNLERIHKRGLGLAAISYDSVAVLKSFADRKKIAYALLSDADSKAIRAFGIFNDSIQPDAMSYGVPYPGTYILDTNGVVVSRYFEDDYRERFSASDILVRQFGDVAAEAAGTVQGKQVRLTTAASMPMAHPGERILLSLELELKPKMHVYAPGVADYIPIEWKLADGPMVKAHELVYPASEMLRLKAIGETVPVYRGRIRLTREITFGAENVVRPLLSPSGDLVLKGSFRYQACDDRVCYPPETVPLEWHFPFEGLVRERAPAELQRKAR
jgi:hypothetical protein